jgi:hypothetical protein
MPSFLARLTLLVTMVIGATAWGVDLPAAKHYYESATREFDLGHFEEAAQEFEASYRASGDPALLYNIAQSYRQARNFSKALFFYKTYLASCARRGIVSPRQAEVEQRIAEAQRQLGPATPPPEPDVTKRPEPAPPVPEAKATSPLPTENQALAPPHRTETPANKRWMRPLGIALMAAGVASIAVGGVMSGLAANASQTIAQGHGEFTTDLQSTEADGKRFQIAAAVLYAVGGGLAVAGAVPFGLSFRGGREITWTPQLGVGLAGLALGGRF